MGVRQIQTYCRVARPRTVFPATPDPLTLAPDDTTTRPEGVGVVAEDEDGRPRGHCGADGLGPPRATDDGINGSQARGRAGRGGREGGFYFRPPLSGIRSTHGSADSQTVGCGEAR